MSSWNFFAILIVSFFIVLQVQTGKINTFTQWQTHVENAVDIAENSANQKTTISKKIVSKTPSKKVGGFIKTEVVKIPDFNLNSPNLTPLTENRSRISFSL